jgi:mono/diheme cytochrome c family protein
MKRIIAALFTVAVATAAHADAAALYKSKCAACHGKSGEGGKLAPKPIAGLPAAETKKAIVEGAGKMKPVKVSEADAEAVAALVAGFPKQ